MLDTPFSVDYSLAERPNHLRLYGGPYTLSVPASPTMFLRKQTHRFCTWETKLSFQPTSEHTEAGTVLWWNYFTHSSLGIRKRDDQRIIRFKPSEGDVIEATLQPTRDIILVVECGNEYRFGYRDPSSEETIWIGSVANYVVTKAPPVGAPFTGMICMKFSEGL
jgi:beta-xylosidase